MNRAKIIKEISHHTEQYFRDKPIRRAYLFGSVARQEDSTGSDVDMLVELDSSKIIGLMEYINWVDDLEILLGQKVDLVVAEGLSPYIKPQVDREKILIYEA